MGRERIWIERPLDLWDGSVLPSIHMPIEQRVNALTRLVLLLFLLLVCIRFPYSLHFLLFSIVIILFLYFSSIKESFTMDQPRKYKYPLLQRELSDQKLAHKPLLFPRSHDRDVWSFPSYRHSAVNYNNMRYNISEDYTPMPEHENYKELDPRMETYTDFTLQNVNDYCNQRPKKTSQESLQSLSGMETSEDVSSPSTADIDPSTYTDTTPIREVLPSTEPIHDQPLSRSSSSFSSNGKERFYPLYPHPRQYSYPLYNQPNFVPSTIPPKPIRQPGDFETISDADPMAPQSKPEEGVVNSNMKNLQDVHGPLDNLLIPKTISSIYGPDQVTPEERIKYFTNIQPNINSYSQMAQPINNNIGISYNPDLPPRVLDQTVTPWATEPLMSRIDPQLVREDVNYQRRLEMPRRTAWSAKYNTFDAAPGSVDWTDVYDPRFNMNGAGDPYRSYGDVNLGQQQYYYSDIDAYKDPNFGGRSKVDFIDFTDPMGRVLPEYHLGTSVEDIKKDVENQYTADNLYFRTDLMEKQMRKRNAEMWQLRAMPLRKTSHQSTFTSNY